MSDHGAARYRPPAGINSRRIVKGSTPKITWPNVPVGCTPVSVSEDTAIVPSKLSALLPTIVATVHLIYVKMRFLWQREISS